MEILAKTAMPQFLLGESILFSGDFESSSQNNAPISAVSNITLEYEDKNIVTPVKPLKKHSEPNKTSATAKTAASTKTSVTKKTSEPTKFSNIKKILQTHLLVKSKPVIKLTEQPFMDWDVCGILI